MPAKILVFDQIKKLMGWCPNARSHEARQHSNLENFASELPDRARGENEDLKNPGWLRKTSTYTLLINAFLSLAYFLVIDQLGINLTLSANLILLLSGFFIALFFVIFDWKKQMQRYDALVKHPVIDYSDKKLYYILAAVLFILIYKFYIENQGLDLQAIFSFVGGLVVGIWPFYFQLIYWEKKNHKTIYFDKSYGTWKKSYIVQERK
ncbi:hypothetical protein MSSIH_3814 [Methanosarcina siciliae HI350]|uniref:DUF1673 domain-containing protein n=1 Tax=Methanosarcina siciliae HI350 TaxID=1434119 RepID=A0A0E3PIS0_9EURY|nr:DUF1673 domain-containing protein [Methanosarcina siciliae]AKB34504.1 hypothetical protein MSSIH_3814 [Methanosarcina siciliae HI350]